MAIVNNAAIVHLQSSVSQLVLPLLYHILVLKPAASLVTRVLFSHATLSLCLAFGFGPKAESLATGLVSDQKQNGQKTKSCIIYSPLICLFT